MVLALSAFKHFTKKDLGDFVRFSLIVLKHNVEHSCELNPPDSADLLTFHPCTIMRLKTLVQTEMFQPRHEIWISNCNFRHQLHYCDI